MGKKVAFATTNVDNSPNQSSGFNGFASPILYGTVANPCQLWDGSTYYSGGPSGSSSEHKLVHGPGTLFPIGFTLDELVELYWRVRYIKVTVNTSGLNSYPSEAPSWDLSFVFTTGMKAYVDSLVPKFFPNYNSPDFYLTETPAGASLKEEINIITNPGFRGSLDMERDSNGTSTMGTNPQFIPENPEDNVQASFSHSMFSGDQGYLVPFEYNSSYTGVSMSFLRNPNGPSIIKPLGSDLYYPAISFNFGYTEFTSGGNPVTNVSIGLVAQKISFYIPGGYGAPELTGLPEGDNTYTTTQCGTINFLGKTVPVYSAAFYYDLPGAFSETGFFWYFGLSGNLNASSEVTQYWEYDDGNGNPIYDKDTGAQLRDPVTGIPV